MLYQFSSMSPTAVGGMFLVSGIAYAVTTQMWGIIIDRYGHPHLFVIIGYLCAVVCFVLCGPMYPIPLKPTLAMVIVAQVLYGLSTGPQLVGSFSQAMAETVSSGFPDDVSTSAAMSSLYQSACALGYVRLSPFASPSPSSFPVILAVVAFQCCCRSLFRRSPHGQVGLPEGLFRPGPATAGHGNHIMLCPLCPLHFMGRFTAVCL